MPSDSDDSTNLPVAPDVMAGDARLQLQQTRAALAAATGGVAAGRVLAELAQTLAADLAQQFEELPMHRFTAAVPRAAGPLGYLLPARRIPHRLVMGRYVDATVPERVSDAFTRQSGVIVILALGADGALRTGPVREWVHIPADRPITSHPIPWNDSHLGKVPSSTARLTRWDGAVDTKAVASPRQVIEVLTSIATGLAAEMGKDLAIMQRFLAGPGAG